MYETKNVIFDEDRALEVFTLLCQQWDQKSWLFKDIVLPEDQFSIWMQGISSKLRAHWLFVAALPQRGGVMAEDPFTPLWALFQKNQGLYKPEEFLNEKKWTVTKITNAIMRVSPLIGKSKPVGDRKAHALGYKLEQHAAAWKHNMAMVANRFDCNILNLFKQVEYVPKQLRFEAAFALIDNKKREDGIIGMRRKIFSLFIIWLQKEKLISDFPCPIPVDFHALRVLLATNIVTLKDTKVVTGLDNSSEKHLTALMGHEYRRVSDGVINDIAQWTNQFMYRHNLSHLNLNPALWVLSRELCAAHPQNTAYKNNSLYLFPEDFENDLKSFGIKTSKSLCGFCPLQDYCEYAVPSKPYYKAGSLVKIKRVKDLACYTIPSNLFGPYQDFYDFKGKKHSRSKVQNMLQHIGNSTELKYDIPKVNKDFAETYVQAGFWDDFVD